MSEINWTPEQKQVIELRDRNILVSAAAGSGKTAVLVERIIQEITDKKCPIDIDRMLVVTFTKAAAGEMRTRVGNALEKRLMENPEDEHLQRQLSLLHNAHITTIDSFCQNIIKNYFHVIDLDPVFRVADETEMVLMMSEILQEIIEERYERGEERFLQFVEVFSPGRTDSAIEELILHLNQIAMSYPWPKEWLGKVKSAYQCHSLEEFDKCEWVQELTGYLGEMIKSYMEMAEKAKEICMEGDGPEPYLPTIESDLQQLQMVAQARTYTEYAEAFERINPARLSGKKSSASQEKKDRVKALREGYQKNGLVQLKKNFFFQKPEKMLTDIEQMEPVILELIDITKNFMDAFADRKREEGLLDFHDMEHFALEILIDRSQGDFFQEKLYPSQIARELQEYYQEILIDEYQDSNFIQEMILTSISRAPEQRPYLFMVGDVKQSIYQFRLARPELFNEKYNSYTVEESPYQRIDLHQNFRSRGIVLDSANFLFRQLMQECLGGICYDEAASLVQGREFEACENVTADCTQVMLIERQSEEDALNKIALEAAGIGEKIRHFMRGENPLYVMGKNGYHQLEYRDIVILLRSPGNWTEDFIEILTDMGIPAYSETKTGYFSTMEVETILNMLRIIDNPRQDIPMAAVLRSCLVGLSDEELARIGAMPREINYQDGIVAYLKKYSDENEKNDLYIKLSSFWEMLEYYHQLSQTLSVYELLRRIYRETGYYHIMSAMPAGEKRAANLDILLQQAVEFAKRGRGGIFSFTRYIESLRKSNIDFGEASIINENMNAVRIMSIHKSKGLEFPVVFVAGLGKQFNMQDARKSTIIEADYGVGTDFFDLELRVKQPTLMKRFMANRMKLNTLSEEIRILYVALTRAKEMLILTGTVSGLEKKLEKWGRKGGLTSLSDLTSVNTYLDWIMPIVLSKGGEVYFQQELLNQKELVQAEVSELAADMGRYEALKNWDTSKCYDEAMEKLLSEQEEYRYPYEMERGIPAKISVSELKRLEIERMQAINEEVLWETENLIPADKNKRRGGEKEGEIPRPVFLAGEQEISAAGKGTLYHLVMEHLPYERIGKEVTLSEKRDVIEWKGLCDWLEEMCQRGYLTEKEKKQLNIQKFQIFLRSSIGQRMEAAAYRGWLKREQPFMIGLPIKELYPGNTSEELVLVQGIIDAWFVEDEEIVLVDYKTDSIREGQEHELMEKYRAQLGYYGQALERLTKRTVKEKVIYSFALDQELVL